MRYLYLVNSCSFNDYSIKIIPKINNRYNNFLTDIVELIRYCTSELMISLES